MALDASWIGFASEAHVKLLGKKWLLTTLYKAWLAFFLWVATASHVCHFPLKGRLPECNFMPTISLFQWALFNIFITNLTSFAAWHKAMVSWCHGSWKRIMNNRIKLNYELKQRSCAQMTFIINFCSYCSQLNKWGQCFNERNYFAIGSTMTKMYGFETSVLWCWKQCFMTKQSSPKSQTDLDARLTVMENSATNMSTPSCAMP